MASTYTVSQLGRYIAASFELDTRLKNIAVTGEISNLRVSDRGHMYFTLKDSGAAINAVMFYSKLEKLRFMPENGMGIIALCSVEYYEARGTTQLICTSLAQMGEGSIQASIEKTKKKLETMGVFSEQNKKKLPQNPKTIGVVTSLGGAVIQDIINVVSRRYAGAKIVISPTTVQGELAEGSVCEAISRIDNAGCDVVILARGGGSTEDLMPFNSEKITLAVHNCKTPIISAVGHETDTTLSDYAADMRAPTPSAAAEIAVPERKMLGQDIDALTKAMKNAVRIKTAAADSRLSQMTSRLSAASPERTVAEYENNSRDMQRRLGLSVRSRLIQAENLLREEYSRLDALDPLAVLSRGYAVVTNDKGKIVKGENISVSDVISIRTGDAMLTAQVLSVEDIAKE